MIYSDSTSIQDPWYKTSGREKVREHILHRLSHLSSLYGSMRISNEAKDLIKDWHLGGGKPAPTHSKLVNYNTTRTQFLIKLSMIAAISRTGELIIQSQDTTRALGWMLAAERKMPDVFRAMTGKSDSQILEELHYFITSKYRENKNKPVENKYVYEFLSLRATTDKIPGLIITAEKTQRMTRISNMGNDTWIPRPKFIHGLE
jgi:hypothetical protein